jgi:methyltransferase (TIGR00027 family)
MSSRKTSTTAYGVACGLDKLARMPQWHGYFSDEMLHLNGAFVRHAKDTPLKHFMDWLPSRLYIRLMDAIFIPGMVHHFLFRKRLIESQLVGALENGVRQVMVLGAGLDTLAVRMARKYRTVRFFEIDLPTTQRMKLDICERIRHPIPSNCRFVEADLAQVALKTALQSESSFTPTEPTLVILEGVLMYLAESEVKSLFADLYHLIDAPLTIVFGAMAISDNDRNQRVRMVNAFLGKEREATKWHCPSTAIPEFVADLGYGLQEWMPYKKLQGLYRGELELQAVPNEDENYYVVAKMPRLPANMPNLDIGKTSLISV